MLSANPGNAEQFIAANGGELATFDQALLAAQGQTGGGHPHRGHGPAGQLLFNPAFGDDTYHVHPAGMWMFTYKFMRMKMEGLRHGTSDVPAGKVGNRWGLPYDNYMMIPTEMTMDMHMFMGMYGLTDRLTVMGMVNAVRSEMQMLMDMSP